MAEYRIYCAGPLFNSSERAEMEILAEALELAGFKTFLPHRDGFLYEGIVPDLVRAGYALDVAQWMARQAIFAVDVYQVLVRCDGTVVNLNGRVPDEGAVVAASAHPCPGATSTRTVPTDVTAGDRTSGGRARPMPRRELWDRGCKTTDTKHH